ncbi:heparan-sulfate 6-O-sulfotransferase 3-like [Nomascus leucogenys]|uniref:heparan-sulfate 6-O-sulfotransferase 3-like n=1 Tax=Nomascus leucogenys TaxID=61853 RepID=UPI00122DB5A4|nr:heparan-sulfate 6-O-sulfotransferase 3-like [Nomascus leucogenys]
MDERFNKWLLTPVLTLLFVVIMYQYVSPSCTSSCTNFGEQPRAGEAGPPAVPGPDPLRGFQHQRRDVIVFLHIQKTGGTTFGRHLVKNIRLEQPCSCKAGQKKCTCHRPGKETWLFSRFSTGWSCGLHADWTELTNCVPAIMEKKDCPRNHSHTRSCAKSLKCVIVLLIKHFKGRRSPPLPCSCLTSHLL